MAEVKYPKPTELDPNTYQEPIEDLVKRAKEEREKKKALMSTPPKKMAKGGKVRSTSFKADVVKKTTKAGSKRTKRFDEGGNVEEMKRGIAAGFRAEAPEYEKAEEKDLSPKTFKAAFAEARASGDKTFQFNGKKYTTEIASKGSSTSMRPTDDEISNIKQKQSMAKAGATAMNLSDEEIKSIKAKQKGENKSESGSGPRNTFLTKERSDAAAKSMRGGFSKGLFERGELGIGKKKGGIVKKMASGGKVKSASSRADGCAIRGKTRA